MKGKFGKTSKVSKYYENDYLQNFLLFFMSLLTAPIIKTTYSRQKFSGLS